MNSQEKIQKAIEKGWSPIGAASAAAGVKQILFLYNKDREEVAKLTVKPSEINELAFEQEEDGKNEDSSPGFL